MLIVFNPAAGMRRSALLWRVLDVIAANGVRVELAETRGPGHATELAATAAAAGRGLVVAAGGDGTIAEVARGLLGSDSRLGVIPLGTANVLAHELALSFAPAAVAGALAFGRTRRLWPGLVRRAAARLGCAGGADETLFVQMLGAGFDAQVVHGMSGPLKRTFGRGAYVLQSLRELGRYRFAPIRVLIDGAAAQEVGSVIVTKGHFYGGAYQLAPGAAPEQRGFTVALFDWAGPWSVLLYGAALPLDLLPRMPGLRLLRASEVTIATDQVPAQADGDPAGRAPLTVTESPQPIDVVVG
jgi:diacylglycerol kinase family enzyme